MGLFPTREPCAVQLEIDISEGGWLRHTKYVKRGSEESAAGAYCYVTSVSNSILTMPNAEQNCYH